MLTSNRNAFHVVAICKSCCVDSICTCIRGVGDKDVTSGYDITGPLCPICSVRHFGAQLVISNHKNIIFPGSPAIMHSHTLSPEATLSVSGYIYPRAPDVSSSRIWAP